MNRILDMLLVAVRFLIISFFALMMVSVGFILAAILFEFGWKALLGFVLLVAFIGMLEAGVGFVLFAPFRLIGRIFSSGKTEEVPAVSEEEKKHSKKISLVIQGLIATGVLIYVIRYIILDY